MADFEAGSIFIAFRSATDALARGFRQARSLFKQMGVAARGFAKVMGRAAARVRAAFSRMGRTISRVMLVAKIAIGIATVAAIKWASEGVEATNKMNVVFGEHADLVEEFSKTSARTFGIARKDAKAYAATLGQILLVAGFNQEAAAGMSVELLKLAADMASFNDIPVEEALLKIRAGLVGEVEPLRRVGVLLNETAVAQKAMELGLAKTRKEMTEQIRVTARYALIMEQTKVQQGDFARTSDEFANSLRIVGSQLIDIAEDIGAFLLPILTKGLNKAKEILDLVPLIIEAISEIGKMFRQAAGGEDLGSRLQRIVNAVTDFIIDLVGGISKFLVTNFSEITATIFKMVIGIAGPAAVKMVKNIWATVKAGLLQGGNILAIPVNIAWETLLSFGFRFNKWIRTLLAKALVAISQWISSLREQGVAEIFGVDLEKAREGIDKLALSMLKSAGKFSSGIRKFVDIVADVKDKAIENVGAIEAGLKIEREKIEAEIDALAAGLRESGALGEAMDKAGALLRKALKAGSETFDKALRSAIEAMGINADEIIAKLREARERLAASQAAAAGGTGAPGVPTPDTGAGAPLDPAVVKQIEELGKATRTAIASSVAGGIADGVLEGMSALAILADVGKRLFKNAFNAAVQSFQTALDTAIAQSGIKAQAVLSGVLNAAVAIVGLLLSQLDRASDSSRRFGGVGDVAESSQLVRGVIAGPSNVAIAEVGENLKRALATTEEILRQSLFVQIETRDRLGGRGNGVQSAGTAGAVPTTSP